MKKSIKTETVILLVAIVLIVASFASMFGPIVQVQNGSDISFYDAIHLSKGLIYDNDTIPYCGAIICSIITLGLAFFALGFVLICELKIEGKEEEEKYPSFFKNKRVYEIVKMIILVFSIAFLIISCAISFCGYPAFMGLTTNQWSGVILNFGTKWYGYGNWLTGSIVFISLVLTTIYTIKNKPSLDY